MHKLFGAFAVTLTVVGVILCVAQIATAKWANPLLSAGRYIVLVGVLCCIAYVLWAQRNRGEPDGPTRGRVGNVYD